MTYKTPEERAAYAREWRRLNPDKVKAAEQRKREKQKPGAATERMRKWRAKNPERAAAQGRIGNERFKERMESDPIYREMRNARRREWMDRPEVREHRSVYSREWHETHRKGNTEELRRLALKSNYGLTLEQYEAMVAAQGGRCAICGTDHPGSSRIKYWSVDHDHETDAVRGLLCHGCNTGLGAFGDDIERLTKAVAYLQSYRTSHLNSLDGV
jgi:hypothetical protein